MTNESPLPQFFFPMHVRFADTDALGHVFFGSYFTFMDEAFMAYLAELGYPWSTLTKRACPLLRGQRLPVQGTVLFREQAECSRPDCQTGHQQPDR